MPFLPLDVSINQHLHHPLGIRWEKKQKKSIFLRVSEGNTDQKHTFILPLHKIIRHNYVSSLYLRVRLRLFSLIVAVLRANFHGTVQKGSINPFLCSYA